MKSEISFGHKCSSGFAKVFASWSFVIPFLSIVGTWAFINGYGYIHIDKDLAFVNFFISFITLFIDLVIIMTQIRQTNMDREKLAAILSLERGIVKGQNIQSASMDEIHRKLDEILDRE